MALAPDLLKRLTMLGFLMISGISAFALWIGLPEFAAGWSQPIHARCSEMAPGSAHILAYRAIVCGTSVGHSSLRDLWAKSGLLHLLVVSGSHLIFLEQAGRMLFRKAPRFASPLIYFGLSIFTLANLCQAPVVRALIALCFADLNRQFQLQWSPVHRLTLAGLLACGFCGDSHAVLSLLMSWTASLAVSGFPASESPLSTHVKVYFLLAPSLLPLAVPHPVSIVCNLLLGPFLGVVLFPASLICFCLPWATPSVDRLWSLTEEVLREASAFIPQGFARTPLPVVLLALYLFCLTVVAYVTEPRHRKIGVRE